MSVDRRSFLEHSSVLLSLGALGVAAGASSTPAHAEPMKSMAAPGPFGHPKPVPKKYRLIATEEAMSCPEQIAAFRKLAQTSSENPDLHMWRFFLMKEGYGALLRDRLLDVDKGRLAVMDKAGVDMHVLSLTSPGVQMFDPDTAVGVAETANDQIAEAVKRHPTRFGGLASFAPQVPKRAAKEIDRAMGKLKLNGLIVNSHTNGEYLDDPKFYPILEAAEHHDAAIYIHPRNPPEAVAKFYHGSVPPGSPAGTQPYDLGGAIWAYQAETGLHAMRLIVSGVFDRFPKLKIVLGHMGEGVPYWLYRMDYMYENMHKGSGAGNLKKMPSQYVKDNLLITTSGVNFHPTLQYAHSVLGPENILFAIDYPYQETVEASNFMQTAPFAPEDVRKMAHGNAERIFHIASA